MFEQQSDDDANSEFAALLLLITSRIAPSATCICSLHC